MKTLAAISDLTRSDIVKILEHTAKFESGEREPYGFARGKVLGLVFLQESLRTSASLKSAMLKLGGGWIDFDLAYVKSGEEDLEDSLQAIAPLVDVLALRGPADIDVRPVSRKIKTPIVNAMIGMEHSLNGVWYAGLLQKQLGRVEKLKIGMYGLTGYSRPAFAVYRLFSKLGATFLEDPVIAEAGAPRALVDEVVRNGGRFSRGKLDDFIGEVDVLFIPEGLPVKGADEKVVNRFNRGYVPLNNRMLKQLRKDAVFGYSMPRALTDGRLVAEKEVDGDPRLATYKMLEGSVMVNMGILAWLFEK